MVVDINEERKEIECNVKSNLLEVRDVLVISE